MSVKTVDPVCGMEIEVRAGGPGRTFRGRSVYFCSATCLAAFDESPAEYNALLDRRPVGLPRLLELARNLWSTWDPAAGALFRALAGPRHVHDERNPVDLLLATPPDQLAARADDPSVRELYGRALAAFDRDIARPANWPLLDGHRETAPIAYFSAEFGVHGSLPVYSGGLGVLAGDVAKEASDLGIPFIGVGFMYPQGYFTQRISPDGWQEERYERLAHYRALAEPVCTEADRRCVVSLTLPDRQVQAAVWVVRVGRARIYLMDTDLAANTAADRELSARLYGGDQDLRIRQEILLGVGGVRLVRALGLAPVLWHANEGHAAFMLLERTRELMEAGAPFERAADAVRRATIFTTHTPVPAGHDVFPVGLVERYLGGYRMRMGLDRDQFLALGADADGGRGAFNMTALGLRLSGRRNAVSRRHGQISRRMWRGLWPDIPEEQIPIGAVTNGVHVPSWVAAELERLYRTVLGEDWRDRQDVTATWEGIARIPDRILWETHQTLKCRLFNILKDRARRHWGRDRGTPAQILAAGALLDPAALTLGFARRFATYKRASLLLHDAERLRQLLTDERRPVQIIFAGKAHPADDPAKRMLQEVYQAATAPKYEGRVAFVEDYDMEVARLLVQGVDVWVSTPQPPLEASGTSGMKAALNGIPNLGVPDGWWLEGYEGTNGWAVGTAGEAEPVARDSADAEDLYRHLEADIVPLFYDRDVDDIPTRWIALMKRSIETVTPRFSARRMLKQYVTEMYLPTMADLRRDG